MLVSAVAAYAGQGDPAARYVSYTEAREVIAAFGGAVPDALTRLLTSRGAAGWDAWVRERDLDVRGRVLRADEDALAYLLVFGTSFTRAPRFVRAFVESAAEGRRLQDGSGAVSSEHVLERAFDVRLADMVQALQKPGTDERLRWARATLDRLGYRLDTPVERNRTIRYLLDNLGRVVKESDALSAALEAAERADSRTAGLAQRARVFAYRGLASDTSWPINFALASTIEGVALRRTLAPQSVRRVAVVGPGLDVVDKDEGHDYYPPQSLQPVAVLDALAATGLATSDTLRLTALDLSPRVTDHLRRLGSRPGTRPYDLQLLRRPDVAWTALAADYFDGFGSHVGRSVPPIVPPATAGRLNVRAVRVLPEWLRAVSAVDANVVYQRIDVRQDDLCDLVVATNVLLYYDAFEQSLAVANLAALMRPGGILLSNTQLNDLPWFPLRQVDARGYAFSDRAGDGEYVFVYQKPG